MAVTVQLRSGAQVRRAAVAAFLFARILLIIVYFYFMFSQLFNWRIGLAIAAIAIVLASLYLSDFLAKKIALEERRKIEQWVEAVKEVGSNMAQTNLTGRILTENSKDIPIIVVTEKDSILDHQNLDSAAIARNPSYLSNKLREFKSINKPIIWKNPFNNKQNNFVYYGQSKLLKQIRYFPLLQLLVVSLFIAVIIYAMQTRNKSTQNQVWAGMAKETAHLKGTPLSSLQGWVEMLKDAPGNEKIATEMSKDVERLKLVSDRFGKIGSTPHLEEENLVKQVENMIAYIKRRAPGKVSFSLNVHQQEQIPAMINAPLFDWVIENLLKNALDAMDGQGKIDIEIKNEISQVIIDVKDSGKGISKANVAKVFKPGFSTKKRGWGLGLSLSKRIIEQYHKGELYVKHSEPGKGTTFRIVLKK